VHILFVVGKFPELTFILRTVSALAERGHQVTVAARRRSDWRKFQAELTHLFPLLVRGGIIIIDDYSHWQGQRKAVDQYFSENNVQIALVRIDKGGVIGVRQ